MRIILPSLISLLLISCSDREVWYCKEDGDAMYSISASGKIGSADKGCTCEEMRSFEYRKFGEVDEDALREDFGC